MNIDPAQRFSRCADFAQAIAAWITTPAAQWAPPATQWPAGAWPSTPFYPTAAPKRNVLTAVLVPLLLTVLLLGAGAFAGTQFFRPRPQPSTAAPQWQPYVDYAKQFAGWLTSLSPQSAGSDIQRILDGSTGEFHDEFAKTRDQFLKTIVDANVSTQGNVKSGALDSISGTTAQVLVAASADVTNTSGAKQDPRSWRLELRVEKLGDTYKVSKVEFVT
jgi:serine/threonine-protein kinase